MSKQHKREVIQFETNISVFISKIVKEMANKTYKFGKYRRFLIFEPKERIIETLRYMDRIVIRCFCDHSLKLRIDKKLIYDNVACRDGKGTHFGIKRLEKFLRREYLALGNNQFYFLKCDISKYFSSIDHQVLVEQLKKVGFSKDEMWLINNLMKGYSSDANKGLPLGNQTSQWFALLYLNRIDRLVKEELQIKGYVRYMDDMILVHRDKKYLQFCLKRIEEVCKNELKLSLNNKTQIGKVSNGIDFLGFRHFMTPTGKIVKKLRASSRIRLKKHLKTLDKLRSKEIVDDYYVYVRKNAFYQHIKDTKESFDLKNKTLPKC